MFKFDPNYTYDDIITDAKNDPFLASVISEYSLSDQEIFFYYVELLEAKKISQHPDQYIDKPIFSREDNVFKIEYVLSNNQKAKKFLRDVNIIFKDLGGSIYNRSFEELNLDKLKEPNYDLTEYYDDFIEHQQNRTLNQLKGVWFHSKNINSIDKLLSMLVNSFAQNNHKVILAHYGNLVDWYKSSFKNKGEYDTNEITNILATVPILVIDRIGYEKINPWMVKELGRILELRSKNNLTTYFGSLDELSRLGYLFEKKFDNPNLETFLIQQIRALIEREVWIE
ncbi:hypothetical protein [Mycoplasmopsis sturni]|uniref:hypothetical protein n=1 Tax=Mycoplasmopsis sturni TaxID=39047 RepID=UPI00055E479F|nr:hypothetical protein [Mycoplasmopsis sturni]